MATTRDEVEEQELRLKRRRLAIEENALDAEERSRKSVVRLNVGGQNFDVGRDTLLSEGENSYFALLLQHRDDGLGGAQVDRDGRLFLDRDPDTFKLVLQGLRGNLQPQALSAGMTSQLLAEAQYFMLPKLAVRLRDEYDPFVLPPPAQTRREQAVAARERLPADTTADSLLIDVFESQHTIKSFAYTGAGYESFTLLLDHRGQYARLREAVNATREMSNVIWSNVDEIHRHAEMEAKRAEGLPAESLVGFEANLQRFAGELFEGLDMTNLVVAGGAVLSSMLIPSEFGTTHPDAFRVGASDVDLFIVADDDEAALACYERVLRHLTTRLADAATHVQDDDGFGDNFEPVLSERKLLVTRTKYAVTFVAGWPQRHLQLVLRRYSCVADVILNFDVDVCQVAYDGARVYATPAARAALVSGVLLADPSVRSATYESRLVKYTHRYSLALLVPGLQLERTRTCYTSGHFRRDGGQLYRCDAPSTEAGADRTPPALLGAPLAGVPLLVALDAIERSRRGSGDWMQSRHRWNWRRNRFSCREDTRTELPLQMEAAAAAGSNITSPSQRVAPTAVLLYGGDERRDDEDEDEDSRDAVRESEERYEGVVLPHTPLEKFRAPTSIAKHLGQMLLSKTRRLPAMVWDLIDATLPDAPTPTVADARSRNKRYFDQVLQPEGLPRHLGMVASAVDGVFARLPEDGWFGDVHEKA